MIALRVSTIDVGLRDHRVVIERLVIGDDDDAVVLPVEPRVRSTALMSWRPDHSRPCSSGTNGSAYDTIAPFPWRRSTRHAVDCGWAADPRAWNRRLRRDPGIAASAASGRIAHQIVPSVAVRCVAPRRSRARRGSRRCARCSPRRVPGSLPAVHLERRRCADEAVGESTRGTRSPAPAHCRGGPESVHRRAPHPGGSQVWCHSAVVGCGKAGSKTPHSAFLFGSMSSKPANRGSRAAARGRATGQRRPLVPVDGGDGDPAIRRWVRAVQRRRLLTNEPRHALADRRHHPDREQLQPQHRLQLRRAHQRCPGPVRCRSTSPAMMADARLVPVRTSLIEPGG